MPRSTLDIEDSLFINRFLLLLFDFILRRIVSIRAPAMSNRSSLLLALTLKQIQYFVVLAHARGFTQAARSLALTQPALTAAIRQIENLLGGPLFARSAHRLTLTEAGASVLPLAERLLNNARGTFDDMASTFAEQTQSVHIGLIPSVAGRLLRVLTPLRAREPSLRFIFEDLPKAHCSSLFARGGRIWVLAFMNLRPQKTTTCCVIKTCSRTRSLW